MAKASSRPKSGKPESHRLSRVIREAVLLGAAGLTLCLLMALISYHPNDPGWSSMGGVAPEVHNLLGAFGAWVADVILSLFGYVGFLIPFLVFLAGWLFFRAGQKEASDAFGIWVRVVCFLVFIPSASALANLHLGDPSPFMPQQYNGGILGNVTSDILANIFNVTGTTWLLGMVVLVTLSVGIGFSWFTVMDVLGEWAMQGWAWILQRIDRWKDSRKIRIAEAAGPVRKSRPVKIKKERSGKRKKIGAGATQQLALPMSDDEAPDVPTFNIKTDSPLPSIDLLDPPRASGHAYTEDEMRDMSEEVERRLGEFNIEAKVVAVQPGPVITRFEIEPAPGVKVSQITNLAKDLARALSTVSVRVVEVIPGKSVIGLEIPNQEREIVALSEIIDTPRYENSASGLTLALGKDISGEPVIADLSRMPHLLVAGTTGAGKSVAINSMILSILYKSTAEQVRLIMIDPKMLELSVYEGIPHLLAPVVTDMKEAANALRWCVAEMERRYRLMAAVGVRNLGGYNNKISQAIERGKPIPDPLFNPDEELEEEPEHPTLEPLPTIVIIIDELADMMMVVGKKVEELIARLAQKARAAGLHLIVATQRPSVDVITGLIKANIPTRISFQVSSRVDSRTVLDQIGAEALLGHGDMLFLPPGKALPERVHGAFVDDHEVHKVAAWLKQVGEPDYIDSVLEGVPEVGPGGVVTDEEDAESDPLYDEAVKVVTESRKASISWVQRKLRVGYNRAARLVEQMEASGVVGPAENGGAREVLAPPPVE